MWVSSGAVVQQDGSCSFELWAPLLEAVELEVISPAPRRVPMLRDEHGVHRAAVAHVPPGTRYRFHSGDRHWPDPASRHQPEGVHGPSEVIDPTFAWSDQRWHGRALGEAVICELHVGTFTRAGTFDAAIDELDRLVELGITAIEVMPVAQCPGARNWGYDGAFMFAVAHAYGGPDGLRRFVDACHTRQLAVILDVVYNHFGPEGVPVADLAPFFRRDWSTPWGQAINFDGPDSDGVRKFFLDNAAMWLRLYHIDGLRLDAVHGIVDHAPISFLADLAELAAAIGQESWPRWLIAESDANDPRLLRSKREGGLALDAVWADDFHHIVHRIITGDAHAWFADYGDPALLVDAIAQGFAYRGQRSQFRRRRHGAPTDGLPPEAFVICMQNHDQIGNRRRGDRLVESVEPAATAWAMALLLFAPQTPLLFMGEEYGDPTPFLYFTDHGDPQLIQAVREGRRAEHFGDDEEAPDPQAPETMARSVIDTSLRARSPHREREALVHTCLAIRRLPEWIEARGRCRVELVADGKILQIAFGEHGPLGLFALVPGPLELALPAGSWSVGIDSGDPRYSGAGNTLTASVSTQLRIDPSPWWFAVLHRSDRT
ncbi:MAG: malto-oligosyltrehalose trehalohydrolase [Deltaproteobacteria bacterium]|nr:malto-oligosyltrehalose trehalohydrolase [Nannocystaceae bacterium]